MPAAGHRHRLPKGLTLKTPTARLTLACPPNYYCPGSPENMASPNPLYQHPLGATEPGSWVMRPQHCEPHPHCPAPGGSLTPNSSDTPCERPGRQAAWRAPLPGSCGPMDLQQSHQGRKTAARLYFQQGGRWEQGRWGPHESEHSPALTAHSRLLGAALGTAWAQSPQSPSYSIPESFPYCSLFKAPLPFLLS